MADDIVQGGMFGGLNYQPLGWDAPTGSQPAQSSGSSDWSTIPDYLAGLPSSFAPSQTSQGTVVTSQGGATGSAGVAGTGAPAYAIGTPSNAAAGSQPAPSTGIQSGSLGDYFLRGVIIVLGFIFVAIGLNMFRPGIVPNPVRLATR